MFKLARWDGEQISELSAGIQQIDFGRLKLVNAVAVFDDGTGPAVYVAGAFAPRGLPGVAGFARWNGSTWSAVGDFDFTGDFTSLAVFNDGTGPALYLAGQDFRRARGGLTIIPLISWNGTAWRTFVRNTSPTMRISNLLPVHSGSARGLYFGGQFNITIFAPVFGQPATQLTDLGVWDGQVFRPVGNFNEVFPTVANPALTRGVESLGAMEGPGGTEIHFGARFRNTDTIRLARMKDGFWERLPGLPNGSMITKSFNALDPSLGTISGFDDGFGPQLHVAAPIQTPVAGGLLQLRSWARWTGAQWELLDPVVGSQRASDPVDILSRLTGNFLPLDLNGRPALLRSSTPPELKGRGLLRWGRQNAPCP